LSSFSFFCLRRLCRRKQKKENSECGEREKASNKNSKKRKKSLKIKRLFLAIRTGLEPATSAVTGRHSNQLNYRINFILKVN
jgi:hypothetical protein